MLYTTFAKAKEANACTESYRKMAEHLGGVRKYGKDTAIPLDEVLKVCGLQNTIWCFRCTTEPSNDILIEFSCRCAEHVLHFFEDKHPDDKRPRKAIEAARVCITDKSAAGAAGAARDAAWAAGAARVAAWAAGAAGWVAGDAAWAAGAARDAAWVAAGAARDAAWVAAGAARDAAWAAAGWVAESEWQARTLLELLGREVK